MHATLKAPSGTALESCGRSANEPGPLLALSGHPTRTDERFEGKKGRDAGGTRCLLMTHCRHRGLDHSRSANLTRRFLGRTAANLRPLILCRAV